MCLFISAEAKNSADAIEKDRVAVMDIEDKSGKFKKKALENGTELLFANFTRTKKYLMIPLSERNKALLEKSSELAKESRMQCFDERCQISLTKRLQANLLINSQITETSGECTINEGKNSIVKLKEGFEFLGFMIYPNKVRISGKKLRKNIARVKKEVFELKTGKIDTLFFCASMQSGLAHLKEGSFSMERF